MPAAVVAYLASHRVGRLATADAAGRPHVVPVCYAFDGATLAIALDEKPKRVAVTALRRVRNLLVNPAVALVVDDYDEDWRRLAWVLVEGTATLVAPGETGHAAAVTRLHATYPQYATTALDARPLIRLTIARTAAWGTLDRPLANTEPERLSVAGVVRGRRSVRAYTDQPVPRDLIDACLMAAGWAPSPHGRQPWRFALITRPDMKERLATAMAAEWERNLALDGQPPAVVATRLAKSRARLLATPVLVLSCLYLVDLDVYPDARRQAAEMTMAVQSLGAAVQNLLLTAYHLGLDTGWMCAPLFCPETVVGALELDPALVPHALITLGYAARDPVRRPRRPLADLLVLDA
ncbi:MAG: TIGR03668 family PPOX class F420-dependent oxidoreductase [Chloroflexi bacterium]|nr:TIGR03668 family PPOX class F420-dependent oxidoreductase [Chloroflexota bacterium]